MSKFTSETNEEYCGGGSYPPPILLPPLPPPPSEKGGRGMADGKISICISVLPCQFMNEYVLGVTCHHCWKCEMVKTICVTIC